MITSEDDKNGKDNDSKDNGNNGKDNNNGGGNGDSGGGSVFAGGSQGNIVRLVAVLCGASVVWHLNTVGIIPICFGAKYSGLNSIRHVRTWRFFFGYFLSRPDLDRIRPVYRVGRGLSTS
jgi:hypothetical protein